SSSLPPITTTSISTVTPTETTPIRQYTRRTRIAQSSVPPTVADEPAYPQRDASQKEACPTDSNFIADQDRATIDKSSTLPHDSAPRVTSPAAVEGSMQQTIPELTALCTSLQRQLSELTDKFQAQEVEINRLKERVKLLEEREGLAAKSSRDDAPIKGMSMDEGEAATERINDYSEEMETVLTSMDASYCGYTSYKKKGQREQLEREDQRTIEQIARDAEVARIHVKEELQKIPIERRVELISDLVKYQDNYTKIYKFQSQQRKPWTKKQKRDYYMAVIRNFIPMGSKEEAEIFKRKGIRIEQESTKKQKTFEEVTEEAKSLDEILKEKVKEMMQLVPIKEVYVEALQVKHPIINWKVHIERQRSYWNITKLGGSSANAATVLASGVVDVPTGSGSIPTASIIAEGSVPTGSEEAPTFSPVFTTATVVTPVTRRKDKEVMVESETPKK
nr:hypothetical protein [Tanacetum cinerariifolium]